MAERRQPRVFEHRPEPRRRDAHDDQISGSNGLFEVSGGRQLWRELEAGEVGVIGVFCVDGLSDLGISGPENGRVARRDETREATVVPHEPAPSTATLMTGHPNSAASAKATVGGGGPAAMP